MATYDYIRIEWSNPCDIINDDNIPIIYSEGFQNVLYFDDNLSSPIYAIDDEGKKTNGTTKLEKQVWEKKYGIEIVCVEAVADILSTLPLHDTVKIIDKDGTSYVNKGADIEVEILPAEFQVPIQEMYHPVMRATITFTANLINKTACCANMTMVECSDVVPELLGMVESPAGTVTLSGTSPEGTLIRALYREYLEQVDVNTLASVTDVTIVSSTLAYCCTKDGKIYKSINGGNSWAMVFSTANELYGIAWDLEDEIYAVGESGTIVSGTITDDIFASVVFAGSEDLRAVAFAQPRKGMAVGNSGSAAYILAGTATSKNLGVGTNDLLDVAADTTNNYIVACGKDYITWTDDYGTTVTATAHLGTTFNCVAWRQGELYFYFGTADNKIYNTNDKGVTINLLKTIGFPFKGMTSRPYAGDVRIYALASNGQVYYDDNGTDTFVGLYTHSNSATSNRIRALSGQAEYLMTALVDGRVGTTETPMNNGNAATSVVFNIDGIVQVLLDRTTYEFALQTFIFAQDPCETCATQLFNT